MSLSRPYITGLLRNYAAALTGHPIRAATCSSPRRSLLPCYADHTSTLSSRKFSNKASSLNSPSYSTVPQCPASTCACAATPELDIERDAKLAGTAPAYDQHVVIFTGRSDWKSRIEDEGALDGEKIDIKRSRKAMMRSWIDGARPGAEKTPGLAPGQREVGLARGLKKLLGRDGRYFDPHHTIAVTNSSFQASSESGETEGPPTVSAFLFPSFTRIDNVPDSADGHDTFVRHILSQSPELSNAPLPPVTSVPIKGPIVLICSHGTRDKRCGVLGPILHAEFTNQLEKAGIVDSSVSVGMVSHVGGHKWAGNVMIYVPPGWPKRQTRENGGKDVAADSGLGGKGVWYARVEPKHVEGLIKETILGGRVVEDLCRGVVWS